ncbi:membrane protein [Micromonospora sonchi]|uniref:Membrane protein n=1 Tax=Micromonospora sonchi TaxID=1763543 RepID=A0A917X043_9ACTN|nr:DoxX family protein [Micromonospora sonchi]GGM45769.1 membrane protein [Micromonospora sonchi]
MTLPVSIRDVGVLLARIGVGIVFFAHGWQKLVTNGVDGTAAFFGQVGVPMPTASAWFATGVELLGGAALILGVAVPVVGALLTLQMIGAFAFVHAGNGLFVDQGGYELVLTLGAASLLLVAVGAGRFSLDHLLSDRRRSGAPDSAELAAAGRA